MIDASKTKIEKIQPEQEPAKPESGVEKPMTLEIPKSAQEKKLKDAEVEKSTPAPSLDTLPAVQSEKEQKLAKEIEQILSADLENFYLDMAPDLQAEFKKTGEETANKIKNLLSKTKVNIKKILKLIKDWFNKIPGVNQSFLEQESKIKTDRILQLKKTGGKS